MRSGVAVIAAACWVTVAATAAEVRIETFDVPAGAHPHDVAPAPDGTVWYTAQHQGALGRLNPVTGEIEQIPLGAGSRPHGVIVGPKGDAWVTDGGLNAIVRIDPTTRAVATFPLPEGSAYANLNTAAFDGNGILWFTGQSGVYGSVDPARGAVQVFDAPGGGGPYGITATPDGTIYYASLAGSHIACVDSASGAATVIEPPTADQGARRLWSDSKGVLWVSEWHAGQLGRFDPASGAWREWRLPGERPRAYAIYVDERDMIWLSDFGANAILRFDPASETFESFPSDRPNAQVRQLLGREGEVWAPESGADRLVVLRYR